MTSEFRKPFAPPPIIFGAALMVGIPFGLLMPFPLLPLWLQLPLGFTFVLAGVLSISMSMSAIAAADTTYNPYAVSTSLVTQGIYRYTRNPGYLGLALIQLGFASLFDNLWIAGTAVIAVWVTTEFVIKLEEEKLTAAFGHAYEDYLASVRRWF